MNSSINLLIYRLHLLAHWHPREKRIAEAIKRLKNETQLNRVIDVGCGPADLSRKVLEEGLKYYGIDPDLSAIELAKSKIKQSDRVHLELGSAEHLPSDLNKRDLVVLNGAAHHLPENIFTEFLNAALKAKYLLILDHDKVTTLNSFFSIFQRGIQLGDKGKYLREIDSFKHLDGWKLISMEQFLISPLGFPLWPYFSALYESTA